MQRVSKFLRSAVFFLAVVFVTGSQPVRADDVATVKVMLEKALETKNKAAFDAVLNVAVVAWPDKRSLILKIAQDVQADWLDATHIEEINMAQKAAVEAEVASKARGIIYFIDPKLWNAQAELGAGSSTGDTNEKALSIGLKFNRKFGKKWEHDLDMDFDYARSSGTTKRQRFLTKYETIWRPWESAFLLNFTELELDRFSGYDYRVVENIGVGFDLLDTDRYKLRVEGGPGIRFSQLEDTGLRETEFLGRLSTTFDWKISEYLSLRDKTSVIFATESNTVENDLRLSAKLNNHMTARLSFDTKYDSNPPINTSAWDTSTRVTLVFGF
ncbi:MAG: DUF481 domain-containing protein [Kordiimonadaceae bacterium]|nr:DUF481 domain-containing protein [Kordiimonadaceae bacterium]